MMPNDKRAKPPTLARVIKQIAGHVDKRAKPPTLADLAAVLLDAGDEHLAAAQAEHERLALACGASVARIDDAWVVGEDAKRIAKLANRAHTAWATYRENLFAGGRVERRRYHRAAGEYAALHAAFDAMPQRDAEGMMRYVHECWWTADPRPPVHPARPLVEAAVAAAVAASAKPAARAIIRVLAHGDVHFTKSHSIVDHVSHAPLGHVDAIEVDGEPLVTPAPGRAFAKPNLGGRQGEMLPVPRTVNGEAGGDVVLSALAQYDLLGDERNPIRGDTATLLRFANASVGGCVLGESDGALLIAGRSTPAAKQRFWRAAELARDVKQYRVGKDGVRRWRQLAEVSVIRDDGSVAVARALWMRNYGEGGWRLDSTLAHAVTLEGGTRGPATARAAVERTVSGIEAMMHFAANDGKTGVSILLQPDGGKKTGPGPWAKIPWRAVLLAGGEPVPPNANYNRSEKYGKRFARRVDQLLALDHPTLEFRFKPSPREEPVLCVRAKQRFVEARKLAGVTGEQGAWTPYPVAKLLRRRGENLSA